MITSGRAAIASSYEISGTGLANANTIGFSFIERIISCESILPFDSPTNTSAPLIASSNVWTSRRSVANNAFCGVRFSRSEVMTPLESSITIFSFLTPNATYIFVHEIAAAPAPFTTSLTLLIFLPATSKAFFKPAAEMIAVPCWSSCITGISSVRFNRSSIAKHSGALMSSRLIPPKVGAIFSTASQNLSGSCSLTSISNTSIPPYILNNKPLPSITGLPLIAPILPKPRTAVPLLITATKLPFAVYLYTSSGFCCISKQGYATPGE